MLSASTSVAFSSPTDARSPSPNGMLCFTAFLVLFHRTKKLRLHVCAHRHAHALLLRGARVAAAVEAMLSVDRQR
eukprot:5638788-Pleurochrysis_carterae.AAC.1